MMTFYDGFVGGLILGAGLMLLLRHGCRNYEPIDDFCERCRERGAV
jgi:hypothetical protein